MKKISLLFLTALLLFSFTACSAYSDEEAGAIIDELLTREADLNGYIYGNSFKTAEDPGEDVDSTYQKYYTVHPESKYLTLASLQKEVDSLFASAAREEIEDYAFNGISDGDSYSSPPRFAEDKDGNLQINVADHMYEQMRTVALLGSTRVKRATATHIKAEITVIRYDKNGTPYEAKKDVELRQEEGEWRLLSQTMVIGVTDTRP